jgi:hypothetical protein
MFRARKIWAFVGKNSLYHRSNFQNGYTVVSLTGGGFSAIFWNKANPLILQGTIQNAPKRQNR